MFWKSKRFNMYKQCFQNSVDKNTYLETLCQHVETLQQR